MYNNMSIPTGDAMWDLILMVIIYGGWYLLFFQPWKVDKNKNKIVARVSSKGGRPKMITKGQQDFDGNYLAMGVFGSITLLIVTLIFDWIQRW